MLVHQNIKIITFSNMQTLNTILEFLAATWMSAILLINYNFFPHVVWYFLLKINKRSKSGVSHVLKSRQATEISYCLM